MSASPRTSWRLLGGLLGGGLLVGCGPGSEAGDAGPGRTRGQGILGGDTVAIQENPWQVSLQSAAGEHFCGGAILNDSWVLTTQGCVDQPGAYTLRSPLTLRVAAGSSRLSLLGSEGQLRQVDELVPYPGFRNATEGHDVALLHLKKPLDLSAPEVQRIGLATEAHADSGWLGPGAPATVSGWGVSDVGTVASDWLQAVTVTFLAPSDAPVVYPWPLSGDQLVAGNKAGGGKAFCAGDTGGPLVIQHSGLPMLAGLASWGQGCEGTDSPGLYARIPSFQPWIHEVTRGRFLTLRESTGLEGSAASWRHFPVQVPPRTRLLNVSLSGGSGDGDLAVRFGAPPTESHYDCNPYVEGNVESCGIPNPLPGTWYVSLYGFSNYAGVSLKVTAQVPQWTPTASLKSPRWRHTATVLPSGKVLVVGGFNSSLTEIYDPTPGRLDRGLVHGLHADVPHGDPRGLGPGARHWRHPHGQCVGLVQRGVLRALHRTVADPRPHARPPHAPHRHAARGRQGARRGGRERSVLGPPPPVRHHGALRARHPAVDLRGQHAPAARPSHGDPARLGQGARRGRTEQRGAHGPRLGRALQPRTNTWSPAGNMQVPRWSHAAALLPSGKVLVLGGNPDADKATLAELYDPATNTWSTVASMPHPRYDELAATVLASGQVLVTGGRWWPAVEEADLYEPSTNVWRSAGLPGRPTTPPPSLPSPRETCSSSTARGRRARSSTRRSGSLCDEAPHPE